MSLEMLRSALKSEKIVFGSKETVKRMRRGEVKKVFLAANCPEQTKTTIKRYASMRGVEIVELPQPNTELSLLCKKNYAISVLSY